MRPKTCCGRKRKIRYGGEDPPPEGSVETEAGDGNIASISYRK
jgi:hypothetical protein